MSVKGCPRCKAIAFDDMSTCFNCMYRFDLAETNGSPIALSLDDIEEPVVPSTLQEHVAAPLPAHTEVSTQTSIGTSRSVVIVEKQGSTGTAGRRQKMRLEEGKPFIIGRSQTSDIMVNAPTASRAHARLMLEDGAVYIEDLGSVNHTYINGTPITRKTLLSSEDRVRISDTMLRIDNVTDRQTN